MFKREAMWMILRPVIMILVGLLLALVLPPMLPTLPAH